MFDIISVILFIWIRIHQILWIRIQSIRIHNTAILLPDFLLVLPAKVLEVSELPDAGGPVAPEEAGQMEPIRLKNNVMY